MIKVKKLLSVVIALLGILIFAGSLMAAEMKQNMFISELYGKVMIKNSSAKDFIPATKNMRLSINDEIMTGRNSYCEIAFDKELETIVSVKENSNLIINKASINPRTKKEDTLLELQSGSVMTKVKQLTSEGSRFRIKTPTSIVGVRGTNFEVQVVE